MKSDIKSFDGSSRLFKGTVIYFIGTFLSKSLTILILPLVTYNLTVEEYGTFDLYATIVIIAIPIFTIQSIEAVFKFLFDADEKRINKLISNLWIIIIIGSLIVFFLLIIINKFFFEVPFYGPFYLYYLSTVLLTMYQRVARSFGLSKQFAISGVINVLALIISQTIAFILLDAKIIGFIYTYVLANFLTVIYLEFKTLSTKKFRIRDYDLALIKELINFGLPLVPNNISWLSVATVNKIIIVSYLGFGSNAIYAITAKFSSAIFTLSDVFKLAWQESAITSYKEKGKDEFYSKTFDGLFSIMILLCSLSLPLIKITLPYLVAQDYLSASKYMPPVMIGAGLYAVVGFYGVGYLASSKTKDAFFTTVSGAIVNVLITFILINSIGLFAPIIATALAYLTIWIMRHVRMKSYFKITINYRRLIAVSSLYVLTSYIYYTFDTEVNIFWFLILGFILFYDNSKLLKYVYKNSVRIIRGEKIE